MPDDQDPEPDLEQIGVYRVEERLGKGGMGEVFLAYDERLDRRVAIKRIRHRSEASEQHRVRFRREVRAAAKLNHPAIAQVYDVVFAEDCDSIVMEYVAGRTLGRRLADGKLTARAALEVSVRVAEGLAAAHGSGFVHRDLKAENVMVTPDGRAKILDFGLAKELIDKDDRETLTEHGAVLGTVSSMAPEQAAGLQGDARSDLFSFGILLYETFTGRSPFRRENPLQSLDSVINDHPPPSQGPPQALSSLIEELLQKDAGRRPASAEKVAETLTEISSSSEVADLELPSREAAGDTWMTAPSDVATASTPMLRPAPATAGITATVGAPMPERNRARVSRSVGWPPSLWRSCG